MLRPARCYKIGLQIWTCAVLHPPHTALSFANHFAELEDEYHGLGILSTSDGKNAFIT